MRYRSSDGSTLTADEAAIAALEHGKRAYPDGATEYDEAIDAVRRRGANALVVWNNTSRRRYLAGELLEESSRTETAGRAVGYELAVLNSMIMYGHFDVASEPGKGEG